MAEKTFEKQFPSLENKRFTVDGEFPVYYYSDTKEDVKLYRDREIKENCLDKQKVREEFSWLWFAWETKDYDRIRKALLESEKRLGLE